MKYAEWIVHGYDPSDVRTLEEAGIGSLAAMTLSSRGVADMQGARAYLCSDPGELADPFLMRDMDRAVQRIRRALASGERIAVYGDYDADGLTATCILIKYLRALGADCLWHIPDRLEEGYGVSCEALQKIRDSGAQLVITVDTGVTAIDEAAYAKSIGLDMVITDHHACRDTLPEACAVVDPRRDDCEYPFKGLAGVGVAFKLLCALEGDAQTAALLNRYCDLVALGTVTDVMPLTGENRILVAQGLKKMKNGASAGLSALLDRAGAAQRRVNTTLLGFVLGPRINAAGRMGCAQAALELLLEEDAARADELAAQLCAFNQQRQKIESGILGQALEQCEALGGQLGPVIVLSSREWHHGVVGIVCARLVERFNRPALLICTDGEQGRGSARSVPGFHIVEALGHCSDLLEGFGGHELAAGFTIKDEHLSAFRERLCTYAAGLNQTQGAQQPLHIDCAVDAGELTERQVEELTALEPFGTGNPQPVFCLESARISAVTAIGAGKHTRLRINGAGGLDAVYFGVEAASLGLSAGDSVDIAARAEINDYRGQRSVQLMICDIRPRAGVSAECPTRAEFAALWKHLVSLRAEDITQESADSLAGALEARQGKTVSCVCVTTCLEVFHELGLIRLEKKGPSLHIHLTGTQEKVSLSDSRILAQRRADCSGAAV